MTPPRAGTFMYHAHVDDPVRQARDWSARSPSCSTASAYNDHVVSSRVDMSSTFERSFVDRIRKTDQIVSPRGVVRRGFVSSALRSATRTRTVSRSHEAD